MHLPNELFAVLGPLVFVCCKQIRDVCWTNNTHAYYKAYRYADLSQWRL